MNTEEKFVRVIATLIEVLKRQVKREDREQAIEKLNQAERLFLRYFLSSVITPDEIDRCPICAAAFKADDVCASDITEGTCHAACLEGSPVVDLETGKETGGKVDTYRYSEVMEPAPKDNVRGYQERVAAAHHALFHDDPTDIEERCARFAEEANETLQAFGMSREDMHRLVDYSWDRPVGEPAKEIGAALLTLASLCVVSGHDLMECGETDLEKLQRPETIARIRAKRATRHGRGPLPGFDPASTTEGSDAP